MLAGLPALAGRAITNGLTKDIGRSPPEGWIMRRCPDDGCRHTTYPVRQFAMDSGLRHGDTCWAEFAPTGKTRLSTAHDIQPVIDNAITPHLTYEPVIPKYPETLPEWTLS